MSKILIANIHDHEYKAYDKGNIIKRIAETDNEFHAIVFKTMPKFIIDSYTKNNVKLNYFEQFEDIEITKEEYDKVNLKYLTSFAYKLTKSNFFDTSYYTFSMKWVSEYLKIEKFVLDNAFDKIIVWGNSPVPRMLQLVAKENGIKLLILEEGYFRDYGIQHSSKGSNIEGDIFNNYLDKKPTKFSNTRFINEKAINNPSSCAFDDAKFTSEKPDFKYIFVPMQINTDTQIISHSKIIKNMEDLIQKTIEVVDEINNERGTNYKLVVKVHPEHEKQDKLDNVNYLYDKYSDKVIFTKYTDLYFLIENAEVVATINSTVGIQTLQKKQKLVVLGDAVYKHEDICWPVYNIDFYKEVLLEAIDGEVSENKVGIYLNFLEKEHLKFNTNNPTSKEINKLLSLCEVPQKVEKIEEYSFVGNTCLPGFMYSNLNMKYGSIFVWGFFSDEEYMQFIESDEGTVNKFEIIMRDGTYPLLMINDKYTYHLNHYANYSYEDLEKTLTSRYSRTKQDKVFFYLNTDMKYLEEFLRITEGKKRFVITDQKFNHKDVLSVPNYLDYDYEKKKQGPEFWRFANFEWIQFFNLNDIVDNILM